MNVFVCVDRRHSSCHVKSAIALGLIVSLLSESVEVSSHFTDCQELVRSGTGTV